MKRLPERQLLHAAEMLRVMGHPVRIRVIELLEEQRELSAGAIQQALGEAQPTVSQHLNKMRMLGLLKARREGGQVFYSVGEAQLFKLLQCIRDCKL